MRMVPIGMQWDARTWPRLKLDIGEEISGTLVGYTGPFIAIEAVDGRQVVLPPHKNLVSLITPLPIGMCVRIRCRAKARPAAFEYEVDECGEDEE